MEQTNKIMIAITIITIVLMSVLLVIAVTIIRLKMDNNNITSSMQLLKDKLIPTQPTIKHSITPSKVDKKDKQQDKDGVEEL